MKRLISLVLLAACLLIFLSSCAVSRPDTDRILSDFCHLYGDMPAGYRYRSSAAEWEAEALPPGMADVLFSEDNGENDFSLCREYAFYLAGGFGGGEILILRAGTREDAMRLSAMCERRLLRVRRTLPESDICRDACVFRSGNDVILLLLPDNTHAQTILRRLY